MYNTEEEEDNLNHIHNHTRRRDFSKHPEKKKNTRRRSQSRSDIFYILMALKVLSALDSARTQLYHFKAIIIAGMGLFTDAYDLFCMPPIITLIGHIYYPDRTNYDVPVSITSAIISLAFLGAVFGNLVAGSLGDIYGRRRVYGPALLLMVLSAFGCGFSICTSRTCVLVSLGFFRFCLGVGIGSNYPLSATIMSEFANKRTRGGVYCGGFLHAGAGDFG